MENEAFTFWALFGRATITVKIVMIMLIGSSFWSWSIIFKKLISFRTARTEASNFDQSFWSGEPLDELFEKLGPDPTGHTERVFAAGMVEWGTKSSVGWSHDSRCASANRSFNGCSCSA